MLVAELLKLVNPPSKDPIQRILNFKVEYSLLRDLKILAPPYERFVEGKACNRELLVDLDYMIIDAIHDIGIISRQRQLEERLNRILVGKPDNSFCIGRLL